MIAKGEPWERPVAAGIVPDLVVTGDDRALVDALEPWRDGVPLVAWTPRASAFAGSIGLGADGPSRSLEVACDLVVMAGAERPALNAVVFGKFPAGRFTRDATITCTVDGREVFSGRATNVIVGNGQFVAGADLFPRGHPGDGRAEVLVIGVPKAQRAAFRERLASGDATRHADVHRASGADVQIAADRPLDVFLDGVKAPGVRAAEIHVRPGAFRLLL